MGALRGLRCTQPRLKICCSLSPPAGDLQDGRHRDHDENERGRPDARAEGGQDLLQDG